MSNFLIRAAVEVVQSPKTTIAVAGGTIFNGLATQLVWVESNIGFISAIIGALSLIILTIIRIKRSREKSAMHKLQMKIAKHDFEIRLAKIELRIEDDEA